MTSSGQSRSQAALTHAGGVVCRWDDGRRCLLVRSTDGKHWVLPKGHIEPGETPEQAAVREVVEEAGVHSSVLRSLGLVEYTTPSGLVRMEVFLMRFIDEEKSVERRPIRWCSFDEAAALVDFDEIRKLIAHAKDEGSLAGDGA